MVVKDGDGVLEAAAKLRDELARRRACGSASTTGSTPRSAAGPSTPSSRAIRSGSRSARATWPPATWSLVRRVDGVEDAGRRWPRWSAAVLAALDADQQALLRRGAGAPRGAHRRRVHAGRGDRGGGRRAGPGCRGRRSASRARPKANGQGVTVRCLIRADGSVPDSEDEPDLVASSPARTDACGPRPGGRVAPPAIPCAATGSVRVWVGRSCRRRARAAGSGSPRGVAVP